MRFRGGVASTLRLLRRREHKTRHSHLSSTERAALEAVVAGPYMLEQQRIPTADAEHALLFAFTADKVQVPGA